MAPQRFANGPLDDPAAIRPLFARHTTLRAVIDSVLEGRLGTAWVNDPAVPEAARLDLGCYAVFGGDPFAPGVGRLVAGVPAGREPEGKEWVIEPSVAWRSALGNVHPDLQDRSMQTYSASRLDPSRLVAWSRALPAGFVMARMDAAMASQLDEDLQPHALQVFGGVADFAANGLGFCALDGDRVACAATSYAVSSREVEVAIACRSAYRRRGLARATAAALLVNCLESGLVPAWSASNPVSQYLAERLGYRRSGRCAVLMVPA